MAFPAVQTVNGGSTGATTSHTINLPTGIADGDLLIAYFTVIGVPTITWPAGWTALFEDSHTSEGVKFSARFRRADGNEGASITITTDVAQRSAHTTYRITGHHTTSDPETKTAAADIPQGTSTTPDPPSLTPSWGAEDTLWFVVEGSESTGLDGAVSAYPTNYTNGRNDIINNGPSLGTARRELNATSDDPGTFTIGASRQWLANTVAIRPAAGVAAGQPTMRRWGGSIEPTGGRRIGRGW